MTGSASSSQSTRGLLTTASLLLVLSMIIVGALLFGTAGSFEYWNGWLFIAALFLPMTFVLRYLYSKDPALLQKRLKIEEREKEQKTYVRLSLAWFLLTFVVPGFDHRYGWSSVPVWLVMISLIVMLSGYGLFIATMVQNRYASRVIEIQENQRLIDSGLYSVVRHPMYMAAAIMFTACPLVLGSYYALIPALLLPLLLAYRIRNEEKVLLDGLPGYAEYARRVRFKCIPCIW